MKPKKAVQLMNPYDPPLEGRRDYLRLDFNENVAAVGNEVVEALRNVTPDDLSTYPEYNEFRERFAKYIRVKEEELVITNASDEAIKLVIDTFMENDDEIIIPVPTFPMYKFYSELAGVSVREISYKEDLSFPTDKIIEAIDYKTKVIVIVNPNSPTGTTVKDGDIIRILEAAKQSIVLLDEAYFQFSGKSFKEQINKYGNLIILQTFSKAFGLAGLRLGYIISNEENCGALRKASSPYSVNSLAVIAASKAIQDDSYVRKYIGEVDESRSYLEKEFSDMGIKFFKSKTNFILVDFENKVDFVTEKLKGKGILVRDQSDKPLLKGCVRITLGTREQMKRFIDALKEILEK